MINSSELLSKFSNIIGISPTDARLGFEIFALQIAHKFSYGDQIEVKSLGYFSYRKIKSDVTSNENYQSVILFSNNRTIQDDKDVLLFFLPDEPKKEFPHIDSYLNLNFGKPLITIKQTDDNELVIPSSKNELLSLIESKVEKLISEATYFSSAGMNDEEFIFTSKEEEVLFDTHKEDELTAAAADKEHEEEQKNIRVFDDFELVETDESKSADGLKSEDQENTKWFFDDTEIQNDLNDIDETVVNNEGYTEVRDQLSKSIFSKNKNVDSHQNENEKIVSIEKPKKSFLKKLVFSILAVIIIGSASVGVYLNYDKAKMLFAKYFGNETEVVVAKKITPTVIDRGFETSIAFPHEKEISPQGITPDSMIISPAVYGVKQVSINESTNENEFANDFEVNAGGLIKVGINIFKKDSEYIVQVSSWKSKSKAELELKKYTENGFRTTLIEESSSDLGKYRRVMVGGFKSLDEAKNFLNKNK